MSVYRGNCECVWLEKLKSWRHLAKFKRDVRSEIWFWRWLVGVVRRITSLPLLASSKGSWTKGFLWSLPMIVAEEIDQPFSQTKSHRWELLEWPPPPPPPPFPPPRHFSSSSPSFPPPQPPHPLFWTPIHLSLESVRSNTRKFESIRPSRGFTALISTF